MTERKWRLRPCDAAEAARLSAALGVSPLVARVMLNRGLRDEARIRAFLKPDLAQLHDPLCLSELEQAATRIRQAVERRERIVVYGDYDVDGITATAILMRCLALLGAPPLFYIPDRLEEGYGLNPAAIRKLAEEGTKLLVTVDCGVSGVAEVALARELGMEVIVTDHHEPGDVVPAGAILANPKLPGCPYPFRDISGAGLAFKLAWAIGKGIFPGGRVSPPFRDFLVEALSLAALGTIADVVPLHDENRTLVAFGLRSLNASVAPGLVALREAAGVSGADLTATDVAFKLAPRINAAGRLGSARRVVDLLTTDSLEQAREIAAHLNRENARRQKMQERILIEATAMIEQMGGVEGRAAIVLAREGWHGGVIGIVAARLMEKYRRPTLLLTVEGEMAHGSARAFGAMHLFDALTECSGRLIGYGGHARAAGLRLRTAEIDAFRAEFEQATAKRMRVEELSAALDIDAEVTLDAITRPLLDEFARLQPFGEGNGEPVLAARDVNVPSGITRIGNAGRHLAFWVNQNKAGFRAVAFGRGELADALSARRVCSLAFVPFLNVWRGSATIELDVRDIKIP